MTEKELAKMFDHTFLKAYATDNDFIRLCQEAKDMGVAMVAINSEPVRLCKELLKGTDIHVGAAISFPLGQTSLDVKLYETKKAIDDGADEIDYVVNIGKVKQGDFAYIQKEMESIVSLCKENDVISKVIFENCYLEKEEIKRLAEIAKVVKPDFIKTSTGFGSGGATTEEKYCWGQCESKSCWRYKRLGNLPKIYRSRSTKNWYKLFNGYFKGI